MNHPELNSYVDKHIKKGVPSDKIKSILLKAGHKAEAVDEALAEVHHSRNTEKIVAMFALLIILIAFIFIYGTEEAAQESSAAELVFGIDNFKTNAEVADDAVHLTKAGDYVEVDTPRGFSRLVITAKAEQFIAEINEVTKWQEMSKQEYINYIKAEPPEKFKGEKLNDYIEYIRVYGKEPFMVAVETTPSRKMVWPYIGISLGSSNAKIRLDSLQFNNYNVDIREVPLSKVRIQLLDEYDTLRNVYINEIKLLR